MSAAPSPMWCWSKRRRGEILAAKVATVPADPSQGCIDGVDKALDAFAVDPAEIVLTVHGTTIATNTIIEGKGAKAGLVTSAGFRDVLEIAYQTRPSLYDLLYEKPRPLIPRYLCLGVPARIGPAGEELVPLDEAALRDAAGQFRDAGVEAIAVAFLHSYLNPAHEQRAAEILTEECPDTPVVLSSNICPEYREYPRTSTTVVNAVLVPRIAPYLERLENRLADRGIGRGLHLMTSSGGIMAAATTRQQPVHLIESGPAGGVIGATFVAGLSGYDNLLALDIGGTTAKAALVNGGRPQIADEFEVGAAAMATVTGARGPGLSGARAGHQPARDRCRRRQHRQRRSGRCSDCRSAKRRCRSGARLLRQGRDGADTYRRQPGVGSDQPRFFPRRRGCAGSRARGKGDA